jgi:hypothetical protein
LRNFDLEKLHWLRTLLLSVVNLGSWTSETLLETNCFHLQEGDTQNYYKIYVRIWRSNTGTLLACVRFIAVCLQMVAMLYYDTLFTWNKFLKLEFPR